MAENKVAVTINGRTVHWDVADTNIVAVLAQSLVQAFGPAEEGA